jgi:hypothetical protein
LEEAANKQKKSVYTSPGHPIKFILWFWKAGIFLNLN